MSFTLKILQDNIDTLKEALKWLHRSSSQCNKIDLEKMDAASMDAYEGYTSRFSRVADILFNKVFRSIYYLEQGENASWLDVTAFMEKKSIIDDMTNARMIKETRNDIIHEYMVSDLISLFDMVKKQTPQLVTYCTNAINYSQRLVEKLQ